MDWQKGMNAALEYVEENLTEAIDFNQAARRAGCSTWEFQRLFSFLAGMPLSDYIRQRRLTLAARDIQAGGSKIVDIALSYGYESAAAFSRAFSKQFGITPVTSRSVGISSDAFPRMTFEWIEKERLMKMKKFGERGYVVRENGAVYFSKDMDATIKWFDEVLGWYGDVVKRDDEGKGEYGCVFDYPPEVAVAHLTPFRGFHLFRGEPQNSVAGFIMVEGLEALHGLVKKKGWEQITDIESQPWGARECAVTTLDGCVLRFFELTL